MCHLAYSTSPGFSLVRPGMAERNSTAGAPSGAYTSVNMTPTADMGPGLRDSGDDNDSDADEGFCPKDLVSSYLPPIGTVFHLIGTFQELEDSGFYDTTGETDSNASQGIRSSRSGTPSASNEIYIPARHTIIENIHKLTAPSNKPVIDQPHLIAQVTNLITPTVAVIQPDTSPDDQYPACVPHFFGKWTYMPDVSKYTSFSVLLFEDLSAPGVDGVRLDVYESHYLNKVTDGNALKEKIYTSAQEGLRWLHERAKIAHRDIHIGNIIVLPKEEQVVFIDFGMAAVGKHVMRSYGGGLPKERRRYVDAIKGWGRADERVLKEIFDSLVLGEKDFDLCEKK
ncbi:hypothetical protein L211DRAFT_890828 [Terfezia boudieri ATCC MYA-4762]|uniref:Uncharacterized protein n=1 Tax=Terfezia boudieri ATCC MYA-4762 TaxID=1051890 RepID=A0A3N4M1L3_9PEZI|nr:hypothetical protein L211DRAFT_890828 [Terfezia boudieri ATCC MYA-4762]